MTYQTLLAWLMVWGPSVVIFIFLLFVTWGQARFLSRFLKASERQAKALERLAEATEKSGNRSNSPFLN